jgi:hypothetical protein
MEWKPIESYKKRSCEKVMRWHRVWECWVAVSYTPKSRLTGDAALYNCNWVAGTKDNCWPENAFLPGFTPMMPPPPLSD